MYAPQNCSGEDGRYDAERGRTTPLRQRPECKIALCATGFFVIKTVQPHIRLLDFFRTVVKRVGDVLLGCYGYFHFGCKNRVVGALDALGGDFEDSAHGVLF